MQLPFRFQWPVASAEQEAEELRYVTDSDLDERRGEYIASDKEPGQAKLQEKARVDSGDLYGEYGVELKAEGELDIADYREMMQRDSQVSAAVNLKILARVSSGWEIEPASDSPADQEIAEFIEAQFEGMMGTFSGFLRRSMLSMAYGRTVHEIVLRLIDSGSFRGKIGLKALKWKRPENFRVIEDGFGNVKRLEQQVDGFSWKALPPEYFVLWVWNHEGDFLPRSDLRSAYRHYKSKDLIDRMWNIHLEKFASPNPIGKHPPGAKESEKREILRGIKRLHTKSAMVVPNNWEIDLLEAARRGDAGYLDKTKYADRMIARSILLPTLLLDEGESGAYALGQQHSDNFEWVLDALGEELAEEIIEEQIIRPLVRFNYTTQDFPRFKWRDYNEVDLTKIASAFETLIRARVIGNGESWVRERLGLPPAEDGFDPDAGGDSPSDDPAPSGGQDEGGRGGRAEPKNTPTEGDAPDTATMTFSQRLEMRSAAARKFDARVVRDRQQEIEQRAVDTMEAAVRSSLEAIKAKLRSKKILEKRDYNAIDDLRLKGKGEMRQALERALAESVMWGAADGVDELRRGSEKTGNAMPELPESMGSSFAGVVEGILEPAEFASTRDDVVKAFQDKAPIQRAALSQYGREAYTITGVMDDDLLNDTKRIIRKGIRRGASYAQVEMELAEAFNEYTAVEGAVDPGVQRPYRLHNIVRTNMAEAYSTGRMNLFNHPSVGDFVVGYEYSSILDDRTTEFCKDWDGVQMRKDDVRVGQVTPPNHFQCRAVLIPITRGEVLAMPDAYPAVQPAKGFAFRAA